jgi:hypothetical protein
MIRCILLAVWQSIGSMRKSSTLGERRILRNMEAVLTSEMVMRTARKDNFVTGEFVCSKIKKVVKDAPKNRQRPMKPGRAFDKLALKRSVWCIFTACRVSTWKFFASTRCFTVNSTIKPMVMKSSIEKKFFIAPCDVPKGHKETNTLYRSGSRLGVPLKSFRSRFSD